MPYAKCVSCGMGVGWSNFRGSRLSYLKCPKCGGKLKRVGFNEYYQLEKRVDLRFD